jgi:tetratricopeptide (TPR) repeat protein
MTSPPSSSTAPTDTQPDLPDLIAIGRQHRVAGELDDAARVFTDAHRAFPDAAQPLVERGAIRILQGDYVRTLTDYQSATKLDPHYPGLDSYIAELYLYTGRPAEALALSEGAAAREPANLMHRINVAHAQLLLGHTELALDSYRRLARQYHLSKRRFGRDIALHDLRLLLAAGVDVPALAKARDALTDP